MSDFALRVVFVFTSIVVVSALFLSASTSPSTCHESSALAAVGGQTLACDRSATASFHDTPHGVVLTCTCPTKEKKP